VKKSAKLLGAAGVIALSTGCLGAFTASADPFVATLPVTTIATQNGGYTFDVTNTTSETLYVDFAYGAYLFGPAPFLRPRTIAPGAIADYGPYAAAPLGEPPLPGTTPATQGQFFIELSDLPGARDYQLTLTRFADTWAAVVDGATFDLGTFLQLFGCAGFPSSERGCSALNFLYPPSLNPGATILGGEASVSFPIFAGTPGNANCHGQSVSGIAQQYGGLSGAAAALDYSSVSALQDAISVYCLASSSMAADLTDPDPPGTDPIPEPASIALFSTSLFGLGPALWRRRISARRVTAAG
jgi:hypothetical protein